MAASVLVLLALASAPAAVCRASDPLPLPRQHIVDIWRRNTGLPQHYVYTILQARDGYLWVGTRGGLARFDGSRFTVFDDRTPGQLKENEVWALAEDHESAVWVATYGGGVSRYKDGAFVTYGVSSGLPSNLVQALAVGADGTLWIGTAAGLVRFSGGRFVTVGADAGLPGTSVTALHADGQGVIWIGTAGGLASFADGRFVNRAASNPAQLAGTVTAITDDGQGNVWAAISETNGPDDGLRLLSGSRVTTYTVRDGLPSGVVMSIAVDRDGTVWAGTRAGLVRARGSRFETYTSDVWGTAGVRILDRVAQQGVPALAFDREGSLWFGTQLDGLGRLRTAQLLNVTGGPPTDRDVDVRTIFEDSQGVMWLGTATDLRRVEPGRPGIYPMPPGLAADAVTADRDGNLLVGTSAGLYALQGNRIVPSTRRGPARPNISVLFTDRAGDLWIGTRSDGLYRSTGAVLTHFTPADGLLGNQVRAIAQDGEGDLWIGTRGGGVSRLHDGRFTTFGPKDGLAGPDAQAVHVDRRGTAWVATRQGLSRIRDGRVAKITARQGLPANYFYQIVEDGDFLWLTYSQGIARVNIARLNEVADGKAASLPLLTFSDESGLANATLTLVHQATSLRARDGRIWFATTRGAAVVDLAGMVRNTIPPPVHVEEVLANRVRPLGGGGEMILRPSEREIEIHYTALSLLNPGRVRFKYMLEGFERDWVDAGPRRLAHYTNLPSGTYRFRIIAANNDGVWNEQGASFALTVLPRWYERPAVRLLGLGLILVGAVAVHRVRLAQHRKRERLLTGRVQERTRELREVMSGLEERIQERTRELAAANDALSAEKERLAVTLTSIGDGVIATDVDRRVTLMNRVAETLTGWPACEAAGRPIEEVFRTVDRETRLPLPDAITRVLDQGAMLNLAAPCLLTTRDGGEILVADSAAPIRDPNSRIIGAVFVFRDVSERERIEGQLRNAQKLEALGVLAGGIAHDFNNLLTGVFGFVDLARVNAGDAHTVRESTEQAMGVLGKARGLARQLLTFSKAGEPVRRAVRMGTLVRDAASFVLSGSNVVSTVRVAPDLWLCDVDEEQMAQVVDNLLINARQAMPSGGAVSVELANAGMPPGLPEGPCVHLVVEDTGPGIPRDLWPRIFDPFFTTKAGGTGLGLAMVYSIVNKHGGRVEVGTGREATGARFDIYLPALPGATLPATPAPQPEPAGRPAMVRGRILVLDDEEHVRKIARAALTRLGYEVVLAGDDREALALAEEVKGRGDTLDAAILDLTIPGGEGGVEALKRLRAIFPAMPAVASSGYSADAVMARPEDFDFEAALPKPYTLADIGAIVGAVIGRKR